MRTWHEATTEKEQLKVLAETRLGALYYQFKNPSDAVRQRCLELDGNVLQFIVRPTLKQQLTAIESNPKSIAWCPAKNRGLDANGEQTVTAVHAKVQVTAFDMEKMVLLAWPEKFDEDLEVANRAGLLAFADKVITAYRDAIGDRPIHVKDQDNLRMALNDYVQEGRADIPLMSWYKANYPDYDFKKVVDGQATNHAERVKLARALVRGKKLTNEKVEAADGRLRGLDISSTEV